MTQHAPRVDGIDVSHVQGAVDWPTVKAHCANPERALAAWKVTQGLSYVDPLAVSNRSATKKAGFRWRFGYHWLTPDADPVAQAEYFLAHFMPEPGEGCICDGEQNGVTEPMVYAFCTHIDSRIGRPCADYLGRYTAGATIWKSKRLFTGSRLRWVAAYLPEAQVRFLCAPEGFDVWQADGGATGTFPGVGVGVDLNVIEHPIILDVACGITVSIPPKPAISPGGSTMLVHNAESTMANNEQGVPTPYPAGAVKWSIESDGHGGFVKRHLGPAQYALVSGAAEGALTNAQLTSIPDAA